LNIIKITLFFVNYNKKSNLFKRKRSHLQLQLAIKQIEILKKIYNNITTIQQKLIKYPNKKPKKIQLKEKNKVYFLTKNLKIKKSKIKKLTLIKIELFFIKAIKKSINYKLDLLKNIKVFSKFYLFLLKLIDLNIFIQEIFYY